MHSHKYNMIRVDYQELLVEAATIGGIKLTITGGDYPCAITLDDEDTPVLIEMIVKLSKKER